MSDEEISVKIKQLLQFIKIDLASSVSSGNNLRKKAFRMKVWAITLSGLITVILGWTFLGDYGKWAAIFLSASLTALNSWDAYKNYDKRFLQETYSTTGLKFLFQDISLYLTGNSTFESEKFDEFKKRYDDLHNEYISERKSLDSNPKDTEQD
jgi:hypothetical protein